MGIYDFSIVTDRIYWGINHCFGNKSQTDPSPCVHFICVHQGNIAAGKPGIELCMRSTSGYKICFVDLVLVTSPLKSLRVEGLL